MKENLTKKSIIEILFICPFAILPALLGHYAGIVTVLLLIVILLVSKKLEGNSEIYSNKKLLLVFIGVYSILVMNVVFTAFGLYKYLGLDDEKIKIIVKIICLTLSLLLLKIFRVSIKSFKWNMSRNQIIGTLIVGLVFAVVVIILDGFRFVYAFNKDIVDYGVYIVGTVILVAFFEEFLCRGILVSGLKSYQLEEWKINIIQAFLFGILHCVKYLDKGVGIALLITCYQTVIGYMFGKIYLKTKTLMPGMLMHLLWDIL
jgi:membrane protease YdiL (CAAX protease family)